MSRLRFPDAGHDRFEIEDADELEEIYPEGTVVRIEGEGFSVRPTPPNWRGQPGYERPPEYGDVTRRYRLQVDPQGEGFWIDLQGRHCVLTGEQGDVTAERAFAAVHGWEPEVRHGTLSLEE